MALTPQEKVQLITDALRWHMPVEGPDTRTPAQLRVAFLRRHVPGLVRSYQDYLASQQRSVAGDVLTEDDV